MLRPFGRRPALQGIIAWGLVRYLRLVFHTSRFTFEPADAHDIAERNSPYIMTCWHGQHFLLPLLHRRDYDVSVLVSRHGDGEIYARAARALGLRLVRGSGDHRGKFLKKGGLAAFRELLRMLERGNTVFLTADVPKVARKASLGLAMLARESGRPVIPLAVATSRRKRLGTWDGASLNLPFSEGALVLGGPIQVPRDADDDALEAARLDIENTLNRITQRVYDIVDRGGRSCDA